MYVLTSDRSNFLGTKFTVYDAQPSHAGAMIAKSRSNVICLSCFNYFYGYFNYLF